MPNPPRDPNERRSRPVTAMVTPPEEERVLRVARELGMSKSNAARYLLNRGWNAYISNPSEEEPS